MCETNYDIWDGIFLCAIFMLYAFCIGLGIGVLIGLRELGKKKKPGMWVLDE